MHKPRFDLVHFTFSKELKHIHIILATRHFFTHIRAPQVDQPWSRQVLPKRRVENNQTKGGDEGVFVF